jgi:hypothetical protein
MGVIWFYLWFQMLAHLPYVPPTENMSPAQLDAYYSKAAPCLRVKAVLSDGKVVAKSHGVCSNEIPPVLQNRQTR